MTSPVAEQLLTLEKQAQQALHASSARYREIAEQMLALSTGAGPAAQARALRVQGNSLRLQGRLPEARRALTRALTLWRAAGEEVEWARTQTSLVAVLAELGSVKQALRASKAGLEVFLRHHQPLPAARLLNNTGALYMYTGRQRDAIRCYEQAAELATAAGDRQLLSRISLHWAVALQEMGEHAAALKYCAAALRPAHKSGQKLHAARIQEAAAVSLFQLGVFGKALRRFSLARALFEAEAAWRDVGRCDRHICACYLELNRVEQVLARVEAVLGSPERLRVWHEVAHARFYQGVALAKLHRWEEAQDALLRARRLFTQHRDSLRAGRASLEEAQILLRLGQSGRAIRRAGLARRKLAEAGAAGESARAALVAAEGQLLLGRLSRAWAEAQAARDALEKAGTPGPLFRSLQLLGRIALRRRSFAAARRYLTEAVRRAEQLRATVQVSFRQSFLDDKAAAFADLVWLNLLEGKVAAAHRLADRVKSRGLVDQLIAPPKAQGRPVRPADQRLLTEIEVARQEYRQLSLPAYLSDTEPPGTRGRADMIPGRRRWLEHQLAVLWDDWELRQLSWTAASGKSTAAHPRVRLEHSMRMVEYFVTREHMVAFLSDGRGLRGWVDLGSPEPVRRALELLQLNLDATVATGSPASGQVAGLVRNAKVLLLELYRRLWAPLQPSLDGHDQVVIIPHGILHLVPFAALHDGEKYLVERFELSFAPSREVWRECRRRAAQPWSSTADLVVGYDPEGLLPYVSDEARWVGAALDTPVYLGEAATIRRLSEGGPRRVVHLAAHGEFRSDNPRFSTLQLADGVFTAADVAAVGLAASLVVLSGCETGLSRVTRGEELIGMIAAFLAAGSTTVLATHWRVDDRVTAGLIQRVYEGLMAGQGKAAALRSAQAELARQEMHPVYWAAFAVVGDEGPLVGRNSVGGDSYEA